MVVFHVGKISKNKSLYYIKFVPTRMQLYARLCASKGDNIDIMYVDLPRDSVSSRGIKE